MRSGNCARTFSWNTVSTPSTPLPYRLPIFRPRRQTGLRATCVAGLSTTTMPGRPSPSCPRGCNRGRYRSLMPIISSTPSTLTAMGLSPGESLNRLSLGRDLTSMPSMRTTTASLQRGSLRGLGLCKSSSLLQEKSRRQHRYQRSAASILVIWLRAPATLMSSILTAMASSHGRSLRGPIWLRWCPSKSLTRIMMGSSLGRNSRRPNRHIYAQPVPTTPTTIWAPTRRSLKGPSVN
mmetsp:Transcript_87266/g.195456  ORF Transcript_87266/g.195456 Transcript_87266/m.195456 type:complete len:236 (+) Transcript_87266:738-1445(+)